MPHDLAQPKLRTSYRVACYACVFTMVAMLAAAVAATLTDLVCLLLAAEGVLAVTRVCCGVLPVPTSRWPVLTIAHVTWVFVSTWISLGYIFSSQLPLAPTVYFMSFIAVPELILQSYNPESEVYNHSQDRGAPPSQ